MNSIALTMMLLPLSLGQAGKMPNGQPKMPRNGLVKVEVKPQTDAYHDAYHEAWAYLKPLAVFVDCNERAVPNVVACRFDRLGSEPMLSWVKPPCIVVMLPKNGKDPLIVAKVLPPNATDLAIKWAVEDKLDEWAGRRISQSATPFPQGPLALGPFKRLLQEAELSARPDADLGGAVAPPEWPDGVPFLAGLQRYRPALNTQRIATTDNRPSITSVDRLLTSTNRTDTKWLPGVPGGMDGIDRHEFKSVLYKLVPQDNQHTTGLQVFNGSNFQTELGWTRSYPNGTVFADVLFHRKTGRPFEARAREKVQGEWQSYVFFRDRQQRPEGYVGLKQQCISCHSQEFDGPGSGGYAVGMVPGADTVVSDPFKALER